MTEILKQIIDLPSEKRELLELLLKEEGVDISRSLITRQSRDSNTFPISFAQQRLWFLDQLKPGSPLYNIPSAVRITGALDVAVLEQSLNAVVQHHESLRTTFTMVNEQPTQVITPELSIPLPLIDLQHLPEAKQEAEALRLTNEEAQRPFDLTKGPLLRATALRLSQEDHIIVLTMHHIISDGWSMGILIQELTANYDVFSRGITSLLPELPIQYVDFACWQRKWLQGETLEEQLNYWEQQLSNSPSVLSLPTDRPRPAIQSNRGADQTFVLPKSMSEALKALARQEESTLFMTLLAAFQTLLYRYTDQEDICVGTPIANRNRAEIEGLIGFFVNTVVLRTDLSGDPTFRELLARVHEVTLEAYAHQDLPFEMLVEVMQPARDMSHAPLFQVMFALQNGPLQARELPGLTISPMEIHSRTAKFDLNMTMVGEPDGLSGTLEYNTELFDATTIERMVRHFQTLLEGIVANPDRPITRLPLLAEAERHQLLIEWNDTAAEYCDDQCIHQLFENQVEVSPDAVAVVCEGEQLTYAELNRRANQLAHHLRNLEVGPEMLVGLCVERSLESVIGVLGILKAGGAYLPLDPAYPEERLAYTLEDAQVSVLVTQQRMVSNSKFQISNSKFLSPDSIVLLDSDWETIAQEPDENPVNRATPDNLAYVIYTSGSTGRPKGVMIQHRSALNLATALDQAIYADHAGVRLRISLNAPLPFDASVQQLVMLLHGHTLYVIPQEVRQDGEALLAYLRCNRLDLLDCVPSQLKLLLAVGLLDGPEWVPSTILPGGEAIDPVTWEVLAEAPQTEFYNMYGPTECSVDSTIGRVKMAGARPTIGRPVANSHVYILDRHQQSVPVGVAGELYIGGAGIGRGYLNRPKLTAQRFIPDPFTGEPGARLYRTGDLACYRRDGNIEFLGRIDHQVKVRGFRIELGEIEAVLKEHPALEETVVLAREDVPGDKRLVAYVVPEQEPAPTSSELRHFLKIKLPEYMVPAAFVQLEALPLTPNGKVDRRALPAPDWSRGVLKDRYIAPRTPIEEMLSTIWAQILGLAKVGIHDNFFELGGHSLLATQLVSRIRSVFQVEIPLRALFESPTVAGLAEHIEAAQQLAQGLETPPIDTVSRDQELPLSFGQQRLWFLDQLEPNSPLYNVPDAVQISGPLDVATLEQSLNQIVRRHEILRTTFPTVDGKPLQTIAPELTIRLKVMDLTDLPEADRKADALRRAEEEAQRPFDLGRGPLLRVTLLRMGEENHIALLTMHHIVSDGWSAGVLIRELATLYQALSTGEPSPLPDLPIQYADFASWQRQWLQGQVLEAQLAYWRQQLEGLPPLLELPTDRPRPPVQTFRGAWQGIKLSVNLSQALRALSQQEGATLFMTLLAAFQTLLYRYTGQEDISVGIPIANRNRAEVEGLVGFFVNTLVMRTYLSGEHSFREILNRVREVALGAYAHQELPFETLVDELQPERNMSHNPLFQVMFVLQNAPMEPLELPGLTMSPLQTEGGIAKFDLTLSMLESDDELQGLLEYNTDLFDATTIRRMLRHLQRLLEEIVADPDCPIAKLPLLTETQRTQFLVEWNSTEADYPQDTTIHQLVEAQVERTPDAIALSFEGQVLTYRELNQRANRLAHYLQKRGVGPETLVGICVERSPEMIVGLLGILKAGGAYVPMDPTYPQERLAFMLEDAQVHMLLTQEHLASESEVLSPESRALHPESRALHPESIVLLDADWETIAQESEDNPDSGSMSENLAYVIYTSGSTGKPKGVLLHHHGLCNLATAYVRDFDVGPGSRILQFFSFSFDGSVADFFMALLSGATLCLARRETLLPGPDLIQFLRQQAITTAIVIPSALAVLPFQPLPALHTLVTGGESCTREIVTRWAPGRRFFNAYGPTETTIASSWYRVFEPAEEGSNIPIGRPMANTRFYVLDHHLRPVPAGVSGQLFVGGVGVARGYLNRPALTAERFIPDPFTNQPGARLYKTGDLARYRRDGNVEFLGRADHQVKVRGFRIELGEIEAALREHPALMEAVVLAREDTPGDKRLVAYVVPEEEPVPTISELREYLAQKLPEYMVPAAFVPLPALPLAPSGKVNRRALPAPDQTRPDLEATYVAPGTGKEQILASIWAQVLGLDQVGVHDNFFELGGDSILSIQVIALANQAGLQLTPRQLFQSPTVAGLAALAGTGPVIQAEQGIVEGSLPLTPIQRWFFEQDLPDPHHWNQALMLQVRQALEPALLEQAARHLLEHHDALRLRFQQDGSDWTQINAGLNEDTPVTWIDLSGLPQEEQASAVETTATEMQASLDLAAGPLLRVTYFDMGTGRPGRLLIVVHHLATDGVSWRILLEDLQTAYEQLRQGEPVRLPPKTTSFQYWARRLATHAQSEAARAELSYWLAVSRNRPLALPLDFPEESNTEASARGVTVSLTAEETQALLQDVPAAYRTEINDVLLTALVQAMTEWTGSRTLLLELEGHGREDIFEDVDISRTVGWFTTAYPVVLELPGVGGPGETLKAVKEQLRQVPNRGIGYGLLRYMSQDDEVVHTLAAATQPQVSFNYLGQFDQALPESSPFTLAQESRGPDRSPRGTRTHLLEINGGIARDQLRLEWSYSENVHRQSTIERLAESYGQALRAVIVHCQSPDAGGYTPSDFSLANLDQKKLDKILAKVSQPKGLP